MATPSTSLHERTQQRPNRTGLQAPDMRKPPELWPARAADAERTNVVSTRVAAPSDGACHNPPDSRERVAHRSLDAWALRALDGDHDYPTHYAALVAVAAHALARGWTRSTLWDRSEELARLQAQADRRTPSPRRLARTITNAWDYAERSRSRKSDPFTVRRAVNAAREHLGRARFTGRQNSLPLVMEAALDAADTQRTLTPSLAVRSLSVATGLGKSTVQRALTQLVELDYLQPAQTSDGESASTYRIRHTREVLLSGTHKVFPGGTEGLSQLPTPAQLAQSDAFAALGRSAARVAAALPELDGPTPKELAQHLGLSTYTVREALRELEAVGMAQRHKRGRAYAWTVRPEALTEEALQRVALDYGTDGTAARRVRTIEEQRSQWAKWQEQRRQARTLDAQRTHHYRETQRARRMHPSSVRAVA